MTRLTLLTPLTPPCRLLMPCPAQHGAQLFLRGARDAPLKQMDHLPHGRREEARLERHHGEPLAGVLQRAAAEVLLRKSRGGLGDREAAPRG